MSRLKSGLWASSTGVGTVTMITSASDRAVGSSVIARRVAARNAAGSISPAGSIPSR